MACPRESALWHRFGVSKFGNRCCIVSVRDCFASIIFFDRLSHSVPEIDSVS